MSVQKSFTFYSNSVNQLSWVVTDLSGVVVNSATVTASLYYGRDRLFPSVTPGTAVTNFSGVALIFSGLTNNYSSSISFTAPSGGDYVLVVDVLSNASQELAHWERPAVVLDIGA